MRQYLFVGLALLFSSFSFARGEAVRSPVDPSSLEGKILYGYQGWFSAPGDGSPLGVGPDGHEPGGWYHYSITRDTMKASDIKIEMWPDQSAYAPEELFATELHYADGSVAKLPSAGVSSVIDRHFSWMEEYGVDGIFLQRFLNGELALPRYFNFKEKQIRDVLASSLRHGRVFGIMYDLTGFDKPVLLEDFKRDWMYLVDQLHILDNGRYIRDQGLPVVALWGLGFSDPVVSAGEAMRVLNWLRHDAPPRYRATVMGGVPYYWRTLDGNAASDPEWMKYFLSLSYLSPWSVGHWSTIANVKSEVATRARADMELCQLSGVAYVPVLFPGFSWHQMVPNSKSNAVPRLGGQFWWSQFTEFYNQGVRTFYGAMFDEVDEGTAMFKMAPSRASVPVEGNWVTLDADGKSLPSDFYLRLAGDAQKRVRGGR